MNKTKWYAKPIYVLVALALVLSLGIVAVPMAGTVEANPDTTILPGGSLTASLGAWGGTGYVYPDTFDVTAGYLDIIFYDVDGSLLKNDNGTTPWDEALKGVGMLGVTAGTTITSIDPANNSVFWIMVNLNNETDHDWDNNPVSTLGPDGTCFTSDDTRHWGFQDWYRPATGGKVTGAGADPHYNAESYLTPNDRFTSAPAHDASFYNTFDLRIKITHTGDNNYNYEMWVRMHNCASFEEGHPYGCGIWNHAINNCGPDAAWRQLGNGTTVFSMSDIDLSAVHPFVGLGNYPVPATHTLTWGNIAVMQGIPTEVWVDDGWAGSSWGDIVDGHVFSYDAFDKIQDGIDAVAGSTVHVAAGTYDENIQIDKALNLRGANAGVNPVTGTRGPESIIDAGEADRAVNILANLGVVTFDGFTVQNWKMQGICHRFDERAGTTVHVLNNIVIAPAVAAANGNSIQVSGDGSTVIGNEVTGASLESEVWGGTAILVVAADNVVVSSNSVHDASDNGIAVAGYSEWGGPAIGNIIEYNTVQACGWGIDLQKDVQNTMIRYNDVLNNGLDYDDGSGIATWKPFDVVPSGTQIHFNNIVGNGPYGVVSWDGEEIDAKNNWWGDASGPEHTPVLPCTDCKPPSEGGWNCDICDKNPDGTGDNVSDNVDYCPWLLEQYAPTKSTGTATGTGTASFSPDSGALEGLTPVAEDTLPPEDKPDLDFPHGFFSFNIVGLTPGQTVVVTITLPDDVPEGTEYWKYHEPEGWIDVTSLLGDNDGDEVLTLTLTDGSLGDDDGVANGTIVDQGGPGNPPPPPPPVGGEAYPVNKLEILAPWIAMGMGVIAGAIILMRRRRAQS